MNIFKSFEIFLREPLSLLRERFIQIVNVNSVYAAQPSISADLMNNKTQITVTNSEKMYNLLSTVMYKKQNKDKQPSAQNQIVFGKLLTTRGAR